LAVYDLLAGHNNAEASEVLNDALLDGLLASSTAMLRWASKVRSPEAAAKALCGREHLTPDSAQEVAYLVAARRAVAAVDAPDLAAVREHCLEQFASSLVGYDTIVPSNKRLKLTAPHK